ncbi:MAG: rane protein [Firmicutes bacterium]|nr:rane protein [Bacillota bacterium]
MIKVSMLGVIAFLLMFFELAMPVFPPFLKIDASDLPALIGAFALGPAAGIGIELLKNVLHGIFVGGTAFIGEAANFFVGSVFVATAGFWYSRGKNKKNAVVGMIMGTVMMTLTAAVLNYYVLLPLYEKVLNFPVAAVVGMGTMVNPNITDLNSFIVWAIVPFNLLKGIVIAFITVPVYKRVSSMLHDEYSFDSKTVKEN